MLKKTSRILASLALLVGLVASNVGAENVRKGVPSIQLLYSSATYHDANEANSSDLDLSGGQYDKVSLLTVYTTAYGTVLPTMQLQVSPDGGTTWANVSSQNTISIATGVAPTNSSGAGGFYVSSHTVVNTSVNPANKFRIKLTLTGSTTIQGLRVYALPNFQ